jgi:lipopolysaccharide export system protein LptA
LQDGLITAVEARNAHGIDKLPKRQLDFSTQQSYVYFTPDSAIRQIQGRPNPSAPEGPVQSRMVSSSATAWTTVTADLVDLDFNTDQSESLLHRVFANGKTRVETRAAGKPGTPSPPSRVLTSDIVEMFMRPGGEQIDNVKTHTPGQIDFLPVKPGDKKRRVNAERMYFQYAEGNMLKDFRGVNDVITRTETVSVDPATRKSKTTAATTKSVNMQADFDPKTGQMSRLEQWDNFEYQEEQKRARADRAVLDNDRQLITLRKNARAWDDTGSTTADEIVLDQNTGDTAAMGRVSSTRLRARKPAAPGAVAGLMDASEPLQARAERMSVTEKNQKIRYEGNALLWQGASRLQGDVVLIDQAANTLDAEGRVLSIVPDRRGAPPKAGARSIFSTITSDKLHYSEADSLAHYTGNAHLERPGLEVTSHEMRAFLRQEPASDGGKETKLDKLFADGDVKIVERTANRSRTGASEHAEYYLDEERVVLNGGNPVITDSQRGLSRGRLITWFARQDRLIVDNTGGGPSVTRIDKKR